MNSLDISKYNDFFLLRKHLSNLLFAYSDSRATKNKKYFKNYLKQCGMDQFHALLTLRSDVSEIIALQKEIHRLKKALGD
jgi:hypothetical protein